MSSAFHKLSSVSSLMGGTKWYLSDDCLLAAKRMMYAVEYRRFYLSDLEAVVVWPRRDWLLRLIAPTVLFLVLGAIFWQVVNLTTGAIIGGIGVAWLALEFALGPTAASRIRVTGAIVDLPLVQRTRRARNVLAKIDAAVRASRGVVEQPAVTATTALPTEPTVQAMFESSATPPDAAAVSNGS